MSDWKRGKIDGQEGRGEGEVHKTFFEIAPRTLPPNKAAKLDPFMEDLKTSVLQLAKEHQLSVEERMLLRQRLMTWLDTRLESFPEFPSELVKIGFERHGERISMEIKANRYSSGSEVVIKEAEGSTQDVETDPPSEYSIIDETVDDTVDET